MSASTGPLTGADQRVEMMGIGHDRGKESTR
jgi:hypothetical protein